MMSDEVRLSTEELHKLGATFEIRAEELSRQLAAFRRRADAEALRQTVPEILDALRRLLDKVHSGELARPPAADALDSARAGWL